jgi:hypothetical protein
MLRKLPAICTGEALTLLGRETIAAYKDTLPRVRDPFSVFN